MTDTERQFYANDKKKYELRNNREFISWYTTCIDSGLTPNRHTSIDDYEELINKVVEWYEIKYPGYVLDPPRGNLLAEELKGVKDISSELTGTQFLYRLPLRQYMIMKPDFGEERFIVSEHENTREYRIQFDFFNGIVTYGDIPEIVGLPIEEALIFLKYKKGFSGIKELTAIIKNYIFRVELRQRLLQLAALKILYKSQNIELGYATIDSSYARARRFIKEFTKDEDFDFKLSSQEIDELYEEYKEARDKRDEEIRKIYSKH